jgi:hypothetical protein
MYKIIGADQKEYGPVSAEEMRRWIAEGRVNGQTLIQAEGQADWRPLSSYPELAALLPAAGAAPLPNISAASAQSHVSGPATAMLVIGILFALVSAFGIVANLVGWSLGGFGQGAQGANIPPQMQRMMENMGGTLGVVFAVVQLALSCFYIFASTKLRKLESYGLVMTAAILCMLPCFTPSCCCVFGLPIGIWTLVVLSKPEVKSAFH